jgi:murein DD-endopeptidase MepM/ murein hydrolase activator NlpD
LAKKSYTILIVSQKAAQAKKFFLSPLMLKIAAVVLGVIIVVSGFIIHDYVVYKKQVAELQGLRTETISQQEEIRSFLEKIALLEEQLNKLKDMEKQVEKDLKEINELKKTKKGSPLTPRKKTFNETKQAGKEVSSFRQETVSILEKERPQLVSRLHQDLLELRREAFQSELSLNELKEFLQEQKSILLSVPSLWPVFGPITSGFGDNRPPSPSRGTRFHQGVDISVPPGTPILAPADAVVSYMGREWDYGLMICLDHGHGFSTAYGHLKSTAVRTGDKVRTGQAIGTVGLSGNSSGPHLHYEVRIHGNAVNPSRYLHFGS